MAGVRPARRSDTPATAHTARMRDGARTQWRIARRGCDHDRGRLGDRRGGRDQRLSPVGHGGRVGERSALEIEHAGDGHGNDGRQAHEGAGDPAVEIRRAHQGKSYQEGVHGVVPHQRGQDAPAQHHQSGHDADGAHFDAANVGRLLRIIGVQEAPSQSRQDDGQGLRFRHAHDPRHREQAEQKFLAGGRVDSDGQGKDPGQSRAQRIGILQVLWGPDAEAPADHVEQHHVSDVRRGQAHTDRAGNEELLAAQRRQAEKSAHAQAARLRGPIQRLARHQGDHHQQRHQQADA